MFKMKTTQRIVVCGLSLTLIAGCSTLPVYSAGEAPLWLLGEVHDNPAGHQQRFDWLRQQVEQGWRPVIALEQFDREQQAQLDAAWRECADSGCLVARVASDKQQWQWSYYAPVIDLALQYRLPLLAANLSRADAAKVMRGGYAAALDSATINRFSLAAAAPEPLWQQQRQEIIDSHCGKLPPAAVDGMVRAQIARDVWMAQVLSQQSGAVLLAGNGHVRRDLGVPFWLGRIGVTRLRSVGYVEVAQAGEFDITRRIPPHSRADPCAGINPSAR